MLRFVQVQENKPIKIMPVSAKMARGALGVVDFANSKIDVASATGAGFVDVSPTYDGINAIITPNDGDFEIIAKGAKALYIPAYVGEKYATTELTPDGMFVGNYIDIAAGKFVAAANNDVCEWIYGGVYDDPSVPVSYLVTKVSVKKVATLAFTYDANLGTGTMTDPIAYQAGNTAIVLVNKFTAPANKQFKEFNSKADGTGTSYDPGDPVVMTAATKLYAIWEDKT